MIEDFRRQLGSLSRRLKANPQVGVRGLAGLNVALTAAGSAIAKARTVPLFPKGDILESTDSPAAPTSA
jgi:hypothetical protein